MPRRNEEAHRALELLEAYRLRLNDPQERHLRIAVDKVIRVFKSKLFQALVDIQEFYEATLLDEELSTQEKTLATLQVAEKWKNSEEPLRQPLGLHQNGASEELPPPPPSMLRDKSDFIKPQISQPADKGAAVPPWERNKSAVAKVDYPRKPDSPPSTHPNKSPPRVMEAIVPTAVTEAFSPPRSTVPPKVVAGRPCEYQHVHLIKGDAGLGFSIAGGRENPHIVGDPGIFITKITPGGAAALNGRLRINDQIVSVNDVNVEDCEHEDAVQALKAAGSNIHLHIRRYKAPLESILEIDLIKGIKGLGFSIAGGKGNQHIPGDDGIFITKIIPGGAAEVEGSLEVGDRLIAVNDSNLESVTHEEAVAVLKATQQDVTLTVVKLVNPSMSPATSPQLVAATTSGHSALLPKTLAHSPVQSSRGSYHISSFGDYSNDHDHHPRNVVLKRGPQGLGFNIVGGEDGEGGIFVSFMLAGGSAELSGEVRRGDRLLAVNGKDITSATHEHAAELLKSAGDTVELLLQYQPEEYTAFENKIVGLREKIIRSQSGSLKTTNLKTLWLRALFDYDPAKDSGLPSRGLAFKYGDILHVTNASDDEWWQAKLVTATGEYEATGIIPSRLRVERKERARVRNVKFSGKTTGQPGDEKKKKSLSLKKLSFNKKQSKDSVSSEDLTPDENSHDDSRVDEPILSYETVVQQELKYARPVIILGLFKDKLNDDLITESPDKYGSCVPHTTRAKREHEVDKRDYHFVASRDQMEQDIANHLFIEAGQYNGNLYGTSIASVKEVAENGKHCILDVSANAIKRLQVAGLYPIAIFVRPKNAEQIGKTEYDKALKLEAEFGEYFTAVVEGETYPEIYSKTRDVVTEQSGPKIWIPVKEE